LECSAPVPGVFRPIETGGLESALAGAVIALRRAEELGGFGRTGVESIAVYRAQFSVVIPRGFYRMGVFASLEKRRPHGKPSRVFNKYWRFVVYHHCRDGEGK
jgi:hypothetical protein